MSPLPGHKAIPDGWSAAHQPVAESAMRSRVSILRPLSDAPAPTFPPTDTDWDEVLVSDVPARIRALSETNEIAPSGQANDQQSYLLQLPAHATPGLKVGASGHRIRVTSNTNGPDLEGRVFTIDAVRNESESFARDVQVSEHVTQQQG